MSPAPFADFRGAQKNKLAHFAPFLPNKAEIDWKSYLIFATLCEI